jgi:REP element-mobilizing transposase RayT
MRRQAETIAFWWGLLPHWEVADGRYFITIHLAGAIPASGQERIRAEVDRLRRALTSGQTGHWQRLRLSAAVERWLDRAPSVMYLGEAAAAEMVCEALEHRASLGVWELFEYVVMPSHVHLFVRLTGGRLKDSVEQFKTWTGGRLARLMAERCQAPVWQKEWFDHWSRSPDEDSRIRAYLRANPVKAGLVTRWEDWPWSSWYRR